MSYEDAIAALAAQASSGSVQRHHPENIRESAQARDSDALLTPEVLTEGYGDLVPFTEFPQFDWPEASGTARGAGYVPYTTINDRADGKFLPVFETEQELAAIRGMSRRLMAMSPYMPAAINSLRTYTLGNGPTVSAVPKDKKDTAAAEGAKLLDFVVARVIDQVGLAPLLEELHDRSREEGEGLNVLHCHGGDCLTTEIVEMDCLTEPQVTGGLIDWIRDEFGIDCDSFVPSWKFGVLTGKRTTDTALGYHVVYANGGADFEFYPASRVIHIKRNVPRNVKRGISDWYQEFDDLRNEAKVARNIGVNTALQAAIAWIEEYAAGATASQAQSTTPTDVLSKVPTGIGQGGGTRNQRATHYGPGTIVRTSAGRQYKPGPMGSERNGNFEIAIQLLLRRIGIRNALPEYMISGDSSNGNFASTVVAESPFVKAREADQEFMRRVAVQLLWKAAALIWTATTGKSMELFEHVKARCEIKVDFPAVQTRDPLALAQRLKIESEMGWVSDQTAMSELGRDPEQEKSQGAKKLQPPGGGPFGGMFGGGAGGAGGPGQDDGGGDGPGGSPSGPAPMRALPGPKEQLQESFDESKHPRGDNGRFISGARLAAAKKDPAKAAELRKEVTDPEQRKKLDAVIGAENSTAGKVVNAAKTAASALGTAAVTAGKTALATTKPPRITPGQFNQVKAFVDGFAKDGEHSMLYHNGKNEILVATNHQTGIYRTIVKKDGDTESLGSGPVDETKWTEVPGGVDALQTAIKQPRSTAAALSAKTASTTLATGKAVASIPGKAAHAIDDMGTASVENAAGGDDDKKYGSITRQGALPPPPPSNADIQNLYNSRTKYKATLSTKRSTVIDGKGTQVKVNEIVPHSDRSEMPFGGRYFVDAKGRFHVPASTAHDEQRLRAATPEETKDITKAIFDDSRKTVELAHKKWTAHDLPAESMAKRIASLGLNVRIDSPSDSSSRYVFAQMPNGGEFKIRFADHPQPRDLIKNQSGEWEWGPVGGFNTEKQKRHTASDFSIDPKGDGDEQGAFDALVHRLKTTGRGSLHESLLTECALTPAQSAALTGALESVETTDEARAVLESMRFAGGDTDDLLEWDEGKHPRDDNGRFVNKQTIERAKTDKAYAAALRAKVTDPAERKKLNTLIGSGGGGGASKTKPATKPDSVKTKLKSNAAETKKSDLPDVLELIDELPTATKSPAKELQLHNAFIKNPVNDADATKADGAAFHDDLPLLVPDDAEKIAKAGPPPSLQQHAISVSSKLDAYQKKSLRDYSATDYKSINKALRKDDFPRGELGRKAAAISEAIQKYGKLPSPVTVFRNVRFDGESAKAKFLKNFVNGKELKMKGFTSTSTNPNEAARFGKFFAVNLQIKAKKGVFMNDDLSIHPSENELLMDHNSKYKVKKVVYSKNPHVPPTIHLEQVA